MFRPPSLFNPDSLSSTKTFAKETTLRARWVLPVSGPPIDNGSIVVRGDRIVKVAPASTSDDDAIDLGDVAVMPALVNAHTHLEFSDLANPIGQPGMELADWITEIVGHRGSSDRGDSENASATILRGIEECFQAGTGLIGEIATTPWAGPDPHHSVSSRPIEVIAMAETLGLSKQRSEVKLADAGEHLRRLRDHAGISPHAPYSTPSELIQACVELARKRDSLLAMHVAESPAERELLESGTGPFADSLRSMGLNLEGIFPWRSAAGQAESIIQLIGWLARSPAAILVHGNDLRAHEIAEIQKHSQLSVVYCPRTHHFFRHRPHPVAKLLAAGINVALGTDSRASNPDLSLWREARYLLNHRQDLSPEQILFMATQGGAIAMRRQQDYGSLCAGKLARLACVSCTASDVQTLYAQIAESDATSVSLASADADQS